MRRLISTVAMCCLVATLAGFPASSGIAADPYLDCTYRLDGNARWGMCSPASSYNSFAMYVRCVSSTGRMIQLHSAIVPQGRWVKVQCPSGSRPSSHYFRLYWQA